jgi:hypothetical protein
MFSLDKNKPTKERTDKQTNGQRDKGTNESIDAETS